MWQKEIYNAQEAFLGVFLSHSILVLACQVHLSYGMDFLQVFPIKKLNEPFEITFNVRATEAIFLHMYPEPTSTFPCVAVQNLNISMTE